MKNTHLNLSKEESLTLREMGIYHPHARTRRRAQGVRRLGQGMTLLLWKQAKYFWRRFMPLVGDSLREEVRFIMENYGKAFTVNFA